MFSQCKYVVLSQVDEYGCVNDNMFIFNSSVTHKTVAQNLKGKAISAGFVKKSEDGEYYCCGRSISLNISSREVDTILLELLLK